MTNRVKVGLCGEDLVLTNSPKAPEMKVMKPWCPLTTLNTIISGVQMKKISEKVHFNS